MPYTQDQDLYIDDDDDDVTGCQVEDNFNLSFDEGYMGMSPESFEDTTIKLGKQTLDVFSISIYSL